MVKLIVNVRGADRAALTDALALIVRGLNLGLDSGAGTGWSFRVMEVRGRKKV